MSPKGVVAIIVSSYHRGKVGRSGGQGQGQQGVSWWSMAQVISGE
jgi:hypothetical protein